MKNKIITTKYIADYELKYNLDKNQVAPQTYGMVWCMLATGVNRIFDKEHLHEFLFRLAITMDSIQLVENWFGWDKFLTFSYDNLYYSLTAEDVIKHFGFETTDSYKSSVDREYYLDNIHLLIQSAQIIGENTYKFQVINPKEFVHVEALENTVFIPRLTEKIAISKSLIDKAIFFADDVLKKIQLEQLKLEDKAKDKIKELEERHQKVKNLPVFKPSEIPKEIQEKCLFAMFNEKYASNLINEASEKEYEKIVNKYFYLAWLVANELLWFENGIEFNHVEGLDFDPMDYSDDGMSFNIPEFFNDYNMEECLPLLKGLF